MFGLSMHVTLERVGDDFDREVSARLADGAGVPSEELFDFLEATIVLAVDSPRRTNAYMDAFARLASSCNDGLEKGRCKNHPLTTSIRHRNRTAFLRLTADLGVLDGLVDHRAYADQIAEAAVDRLEPDWLFETAACSGILASAIIDRYRMVGGEPLGVEQRCIGSSFLEAWLLGRASEVDVDIAADLLQGACMLWRDTDSGSDAETHESRIVRIVLRCCEILSVETIDYMLVYLATHTECRRLAVAVLRELPRSSLSLVSLDGAVAAMISADRYHDQVWSALKERILYALSACDRPGPVLPKALDAAVAAGCHAALMEMAALPFLSELPRVSLLVHAADTIVRTAQIPELLFDLCSTLVASLFGCKS